MEKRIDETIPGGRYLGTNGKYHDADGNPLPDDPKPVEKTSEKTTEKPVTPASKPGKPGKTPEKPVPPPEPPQDTKPDEGGQA
ncbi:MAG: hypothetical protein P4L50_03305 [Anaerolineaceae bacterium]|nr:hypothetical protein [Anaerolineaceae bacterium]